MKTLQSATLSFVIILTFCTFTFASDIYHPVAHWTFDESSGTIANDSAGDNNGTVYGGAAWITGQVNGALSFDGLNDYVNVPDSDNSLDMDNQMTISAWIKVNNFSKYYFIVAKQPSGTAGNNYPGNYQFTVVPSTGKLELAHQTGTGTTTVNYISTSTITVGVWRHVAVTMEEGVAVKFYINGAPAGTLPQTATFGIVNNEPVRIGTRKDGYSYFNGAIDDVRIYNYALDANEISELYADGLPELEDIDHPVAHWTFDEPNGTTVYDSAGSSNGTLLNGTVRTAGKYGNAVQFDGINDYVEISGTNDTAIEFNKNSSFTISCWAKPLVSQSGYFISKMRAAGQYGTFGYEVGYNIAHFFGYSAESSNKGSTTLATPNNSAPIGNWYHVVAVYNNTQMALYLDGLLKDTDTFTYNTGTTFPDKNMTIGARSADSIVFDYFNGLIDDVRIYNYALDANEIAELYAEGTPDLQNIGIIGPNSVPEESDTQYQIIGHYTDGSSKDVTADANLSVEPGEFAQIDSNGLLTTFRLYRPRELCTIYADYQGSSMEMPVAIYAICDGNECTMPQLLKRNIADTIEIKQGIMEDLNYAMKIERASIQMLPKIANGRQITIWQRAQLLKANIKILAALADELWAKKEVDKSIDSLEIALELLRLEKPGKGPK